jgi:hypothetical protein
MLVKTRLIILNIDFGSGLHKCLLTDDGQLPCKDVLDLHQPIQFGPSILEEYLEMETDWVKFVLLNVEVDEDNVLHVTYACMVPNILKNKKGVWTEIGILQNGNIQQMVFEAGQKLLVQF